MKNPLGEYMTSFLRKRHDYKDKINELSIRIQKCIDSTSENHPVHYIDDDLNTRLDEVDDCQIIADIFKKYGFDISLEKAGDIWAERSNNWDVSWLIVESYHHTDDELWIDLCRNWAYMSDASDSTLLMIHKKKG